MTKGLSERQRTILELLSEDSGLTVTALSSRLGVSAVTVRNDLDRLAEAGHIVRARGRALPAYHPTILESLRKRRRQKARIARAAARLIADGDNVMISAGTTASLIGQYLLAKRDVHVVTNSTLLFRAARVSPAVRITLVGGEFRPSGEALVGPLALRGLEQFHVKTAFVGADGFSVEKGITAHLVELAEVVRKMAGQAERAVVVADSSKCGRAGFAHILPLEAIETIVTDDGLSAAQRRELEAIGINVILA